MCRVFLGLMFRRTVQLHVCLGSEHPSDPWYRQLQNSHYPPSFGHDGASDNASTMSEQRAVPRCAMYPEATASENP